MRPVRGASLVGFRMTVFPVRSAPVAIPLASMKGKLNGEMTGQTPRGFAIILPCSPATPSVSLAYPLFSSITFA